jgi:spermidine/putrescine transport system substrate-binding protein
VGLRLGLKLVGLLATFGLWFSTGGCNQPKPTNGSENGKPDALPPVVGPPPVLKIAAFPSYFGEHTLTGFEGASHAQVDYETYLSNEEILERVEAGGAYDVIFPSSYAVEALMRRGALRPFPHEKVPNLHNIPLEFRNPPFDPGMSHCVPYVWSLVGLGIVSVRSDPRRDPDELRSLFEPIPAGLMNPAAIQPRPKPQPLDPPDAEVEKAKKASGEKPDLLTKVVMLDDMRATMGAALQVLGYSSSSRKAEEIQAAKKLLIAQFPRVRAYLHDPSDALVTGDARAALAGSIEVYRMTQRRPEIKFVLPRDGSLLYVEYACVPKNAPNPELAYQFLNHLLNPVVAAEITNARLLPIVNLGARQMLEVEGRWLWGTFESLMMHARRYELLRDVAEAEPLYENAWREVRLALAKHQGLRIPPRTD